MSAVHVRVTRCVRARMRARVCVHPLMHSRAHVRTCITATLYQPAYALHLTCNDAEGNFNLFTCLLAHEHVCTCVCADANACFLSKLISTQIASCNT